MRFVAIEPFVTNRVSSEAPVSFAFTPLSFFAHCDSAQQLSYHCEELFIYIFHSSAWL